MLTSRTYFIGGIVIALLAGMVLGFLFYGNFNKLRPANSESAPIAQNTISNESIYEDRVCLITGDSYAYGETRIILEVLSDCKDLLNPKVAGGSLFMENRGRKILLDTDILTYLDIPKFTTTTRPDIILLTTNFADAGAYANNSYYINLASLDLVRTRKTIGGLKIYYNPHPTQLSGNYASTNQNRVEPIGDIALNLNESAACDNLSSDITWPISATTTITGLTVNDKKIHITPRQIYCTVDGEAGIRYDAQISFEGISRNMNKIYFSLADSKAGWRTSYSFDLDSKNVQEEKPHDML